MFKKIDLKKSIPIVRSNDKQKAEGAAKSIQGHKNKSTNWKGREKCL